MGRLIIDGNQVYEIDEECMMKRNREKRAQTQQHDRKDKNRTGLKEGQRR